MELVNDRRGRWRDRMEGERKGRWGETEWWVREEEDGGDRTVGERKGRW